MKQDVKELYKTVILAHNKEPFHYKKREDAQYVVEANNPVCGDRFTLFFNLRKDKIEDLTFHGWGCAISKASASILVKHLDQQSLESAQQTCTQFQTTLNDGNSSGSEIVDKEIRALCKAATLPGRETCVTLSWEEMLNMMKKIIP